MKDEPVVPVRSVLEELGSLSGRHQEIDQFLRGNSIFDRERFAKQFGISIGTTYWIVL